MAYLVQGKHPRLAIISVLGEIEKCCLLGVNCNSNSNNKRLSFVASKTGGCKPTRIEREGCGSTEPGVWLFILGPGGGGGWPTWRIFYPDVCVEGLEKDPF